MVIYHQLFGAVLTAMEAKMTVFKKRYRIKSKSKFVLLVIFMMVFITIISNTLLVPNGLGSSIGWEYMETMAHQSDSSQREYIEIIVEHGDTLWNIANKYMTGNIDIRRAVHILCEINEIYAHELKAGQTLIIPIK